MMTHTILPESVIEAMIENAENGFDTNEAIFGGTTNDDELIHGYNAEMVDQILDLDSAY